MPFEATLRSNSDTPDDPPHLSARELGLFEIDTHPDAPPEGDRWSTWDGAQHGPEPRPDWVITDLGAVDTDLGILKTGKEADVHVVRRHLPGARGTSTGTLLASKRYRSAEHRMFQRSSAYLEGRRVRRSREMRAMARRTEFGRELVTAQWAGAEFGALQTLWLAGLPVPYPVQLDETELLMEFIGVDDEEHGAQAAPRLAGSRPDPDLLPSLFEQALDVMRSLAARGWAHGDLSPYNILLDGDRLVIIDWPQIVDVIGNPSGLEFLHRDCENVCRWFIRAGLALDPEEVFGDLVAAATSRW